jgi:hypothetical protein
MPGRIRVHGGRLRSRPARRASATELVLVETGRKVLAIPASYMVREGLLVT